MQHFNASDNEHILTAPRTRPLWQSLLGGLVVIGSMFIGAVVLYAATEGLLWLRDNVSDQFMTNGNGTANGSQATHTR